MYLGSTLSCCNEDICLKHPVDESNLYSPKHCDPLLFPDDVLLITNVWPSANLITVLCEEDEEEILEPPGVVDVEIWDILLDDVDTFDLEDTEAEVFVDGRDDDALLYL